LVSGYVRFVTNLVIIDGKQHSMITCPTCHKATSESFALCEYCGTLLTSKNTLTLDIESEEPVLRMPDDQLPLGGAPASTSSDIKHYKVIQPDGTTYGPADVSTLRQWAREGRILSDTLLEDELSRVRFPAGLLSGVIAPQAPAPVVTVPVAPTSQTLDPQVARAIAAPNLRFKSVLSALAYTICGLLLGCYVGFTAAGQSSQPAVPPPTLATLESVTTLPQIAGIQWRTAQFLPKQNAWISWSWTTDNAGHLSWTFDMTFEKDHVQHHLSYSGTGQASISNQSQLTVKNIAFTGGTDTLVTSDGDVTLNKATTDISSSQAAKIFPFTAGTDVSLRDDNMTLHVTDSANEQFSFQSTD